MDFPSGVKAHIFVSWLHPFKEQKLVVVGDRKMAVFDDISEEKLLLYPHEIQWLQRVPVAAKAEAEVVQVETGEPLRAECQHFLECVTGGRTPKTDGMEGLRVLQILQASQQSLNQNGCKIHLRNISEEKSPRSNSNLPDFAKSQQPTAKSYFVHESSYIDDNVEIGAGSKIWHFSHVLSGSKIGQNCSIGQNVVVGPDVTIGNGCKIQNNVSIYQGVSLEDDVFCGPSMVFTNVYNPRSAIRRMDELRPTLVRKGASIGANATIMCGITIGKYGFVGAGAVVLKDVPDHALFVGNPAQQKGWVCECGERINENLVCPTCLKKYAHENTGLREIPTR
jgi:UDP-2-acetamido-3-amino-2,3-dideoxy-glucuronate N-acetyltransferase